MRKIFLFFFFFFITRINCHTQIVARLIKNEDFKLKGTFTINSASTKNKYLTVQNNYIFFTKSKQLYDIIEVSNNSYYIISRASNKFLGSKRTNNKQLRLYNKFDKENSKYISWDIIKQNSNLTKSGYVYTIKNNYNNEYLCLVPNDRFANFNKLPKDASTRNFQFRILKIFSEEENIKQSNYNKVEKEPIDIFIKYIDLTDKNLKREGIKQIAKDYDSEELRYSLRSVFQYIPWVRKIFIVMPNDKVKFLKPYEEIKDKIVYVKDKDFLGYDTANIFAFSFNLHKMEKFNISKNFIYMEDDYFIGSYLKKTDFFYYDEKEKKVLPFVVNNYFSEMNLNQRMGFYYYLYKKRNSLKIHGNRGWTLSILGTEKYFAEKYDINVILPEFTHCAFPVNIDDLKDIYREIQDYEYINETLYSKERHIMTLNQPEFYNLYQLNIKKRKVHKIKRLYINMEHSRMSQLYTPLFVLNTCGDNIPTKEDYIHLKKIMKERYPNATKYEIKEVETNDTIILPLNLNESLKNGDALKNNNDIDKNNNEVNDDNDIDKNNNEENDDDNNNDKNNNEENDDNNNDNNNDIQETKNENINNSKNIRFNIDETRYYIHGYILLGVLLTVIIFVKYKNVYEFEYN